ncbi:MAG: ribosome biogenesis GTP-binding protein YihA/YsxC [Candidatus Krumholzibacteriia bacterium]
MLKIESVEFVSSASSVEECPRRPLVEVAVSGRSNVGKSSLLNSLLRQKGLARVSGAPGKTQLLNFFLVNDRFHIVDLPGYGYARAPESVQRSWRQMMQAYLRRRTELCGVIQLLDCRHQPSRQDREMIQWLLDEKLAFCLVPTKLDKLRRGERKRAVAQLINGLTLPPDLPLVPFSSKTGEGREALLDWLGLTVERAVLGRRS